MSFTFLWIEIKEPVSIQTQKEKPILNNGPIKEPKVVKTSEIIESKPVKENEVQEEFDDELDTLIKEAESRI